MILGTHIGRSFRVVTCQRHVGFDVFMPLDLSKSFSSSNVASFPVFYLSRCGAPPPPVRLPGHQWFPPVGAVYHCHVQQV